MEHSTARTGLTLSKRRLIATVGLAHAHRRSNGAHHRRSNQIRSPFGSSASSTAIPFSFGMTDECTPFGSSAWTHLICE